MSSCVDEIFFFQRKLNKYAKLNEADKILYYIHKLNHLNVTVSHLEETGVGKTVNALRHQGGKVGEKARILVNKWKEMVTAEEEEEEEEDAAENDDEKAEMSMESRGGEQNLDDEEENCLQIEENEAPEDDFNDPEDEPEHPHPQASPNPYESYDYTRQNFDSDDGELQYNPLTSQEDYQRHLEAPTTEYHPTSGILTPKEDSSPDLRSSPEPKSWNGGAKAERTEKIEKDHKEKRKGKRHKERERSESREKERKKEKHRDKHREEKEEPEERKKAHKEKHRDREKHHHHARSKEKHRNDAEKPRAERDEEHVVNGFNSPEHNRGGRREESEKVDRHRERVEERAETKVQESRERVKEPEKERHKESKKEKHKREHRDKDKSPTRHKNEKKKHVDASSSSSSLNKSPEERKVKDEKRKHKDGGKKDRHKRDGSSREREESGEKKKEKKGNKMEDMDSGFGAALMGLDSPVKKKKKKKKKEVEKERESSEDEQPSASTSGYKRALSGDVSGMPGNKKPKLLTASKDRLPALPTLEVMDEKPLLPEITPNYKPLPRVPIRDEPPESAFSKMTEEEALNFVFQSKNNRRSKVYSGKVSGLAYVPSLYETCIRVLQENIDALEFTGGVPFEILRPVLERASPKQLLNLEDFNAYLLEDSSVLWEAHCRRDFKKEKLEEMETWRDMWLRCSEERDRKLRNLTLNLTEKFLTKAEPKRTTKIAYIDTPAKVPKGVARAQAKYGTAAASALAAKPGRASEAAARKTAMQNVQRAERAATARPVAAAKKKKVAPLMAKTRQFFKKAFRR